MNLDFDRRAFHVAAAILGTVMADRMADGCAIIEHAMRSGGPMAAAWRDRLDMIAARRQDLSPREAVLSAIAIIEVGTDPDDVEGELVRLRRLLSAGNSRDRTRLERQIAAAEAVF